MYANASDLKVAASLYLDPSGSNPAWREFFRRVSGGLASQVHGTATAEDRKDFVGDALELSVIEVRGMKFTDLADVARLGLRRWVYGRVRGDARERQVKYRARGAGVSYRLGYLPGRQVAALVESGNSIAESAGTLGLTEAEAARQLDCHRLVVSGQVPMRLSDDDEDGVTIPGSHPAADDDDLGLIERRLLDALSAFGSALAAEDVAILVRDACGYRPLDPDTHRADIQRARRHLKAVAPTREDVLAIARGDKAVAA